MDPPNATRGRGRGRGYGRGRGNNDRVPRSHTNYTPVPRIALLHPGTPVSIVLKMDQGSGREVKGFVGELLTRGDHPRGVKVRLRDGRVGRVQRLCTEGEAEEGEGGMRGLGRNGEVGGGEGGRSVGQDERTGGMWRGGGSGGKTYSDFRTDGYDASSAASTSAGACLEDYIVVKGNRKGKKSTAEENRFNEGSIMEQEESGRNDEEEVLEGRSTGDVFKSAMSTCPVCGEFEGDEIAVAHHVNGHFE
ncbi:uncharacterized protein EAE97_000876 [Botrytis byssoidea]|uniref:UBZ4-type domain-containing protein n=1 Tax=Botrytis byssoidea TaxID=139641 RepID=A0A9P5IW30_9HELO|nr:uncharacterized protein EAE97_000876 [Botrytis byssoidea]KAF7953477.1 hypothetical protein EAE97_000876 [Botrytis byssoidea]